MDTTEEVVEATAELIRQEYEPLSNAREHADVIIGGLRAIMGLNPEPRIAAVQDDDFIGSWFLIRHGIENGELPDIIGNLADLLRKATEGERPQIDPQDRNRGMNARRFLDRADQLRADLTKVNRAARKSPSP